MCFEHLFADQGVFHLADARAAEWAERDADEGAIVRLRPRLNNTSEQAEMGVIEYPAIRL